MSEINEKVAALRVELAQVKDHPVLAFRQRAKDIEAEIVEWLTPGAPDVVAPSEQVEPAATVDAPVVDTKAKS